MNFVLTYHSIDRNGSVISVAPEEFRAHLGLLQSSSLRVAPLEDVVRTPNTVALTFDDGFRNFREHALPLLIEKKMPATVFVVTGYCGRRNDWPTQPAGAPRLDLMSWHELDELARHGVSLGGHTVTHPHLTAIPLQRADQEMRDSRRALEDRIGRPVTTFAYPYGTVSPAVRDLAAKYFSFACTTDLNFITPDCEPLQIPRLDAYYLRAPRIFRLLNNARGELYIGVRRRLRALGARCRR